MPEPDTALGSDHWSQWIIPADCVGPTIRVDRQGKVEPMPLNPVANAARTRKR